MSVAINQRAERRLRLVPQLPRNFLRLSHVAINQRAERRLRHNLTRLDEDHLIYVAINQKAERRLRPDVDQLYVGLAQRL